MQEVLHADWQEVWHSPQPPFFMDSFKSLVVKVLICFIKNSLLMISERSQTLGVHAVYADTRLIFAHYIMYLTFVKAFFLKKR